MEESVQISQSSELQLKETNEGLGNNQVRIFQLQGENISEDSENENYEDEVQMDDHLYEVKLEEMKNSPHKLIGVVHCKSLQSMSQFLTSTGFLISPNVVVTSNHTIQKVIPKQRETRTIKCDIRFFPGHSGEYDINEGYRVQFVAFPGKFREERNSLKVDYALLKLKDKVNQLQFLPFRVLEDFKNVKNVAIYGYPGIFLKAVNKQITKFKISQWGLEKNYEFIVNKKKGRIQHRLTTFKGQSGAPIIEIDEQKKMAVIGIHKGGVSKKNGNNSKVNVGKLITEQMIKQIGDQINLWQNQEKSLQPVNIMMINVPLTIYSQKTFKLCLLYSTFSKFMKDFILPLNMIIQLCSQNNKKVYGLLLSSNLILISTSTIRKILNNTFEFRAKENIPEKKSQLHQIESYFLPQRFSKNYQNFPKHFQGKVNYLLDTENSTKQVDYALLKLQSNILVETYISLKVTNNKQQQHNCQRISSNKMKNDRIQEIFFIKIDNDSKLSLVGFQSSTDNKMICFSTQQLNNLDSNIQRFGTKKFSIKEKNSTETHNLVTVNLFNQIEHGIVTKELETSYFPFGTLGLLTMDKEGYGTGTLISPNLVITTAHNVYNIYQKQKYPLLNFSLKVFGKFNQFISIDSVYIPESFKTEEKKQMYDYALLKLKRQISGQHLYLPLSQIDQSFGYCMEYYIGGYFLNKVNNEYYFEYRKSKTNLFENFELFQHSTPCQYGISGSPIISFDKKNNSMKIVSIHRGRISGGNPEFSYGRLMTKKVIEQLAQETKKMGAHMFKIV